MKFILMLIIPFFLFGNNLEMISKYLPSDPIVVEAGAHDGTDTWGMSRRWFKGQIHAFEPNPEVIGKLKRKIRHCKNVFLYQVALGDKVGYTDFYLSGTTNKTIPNPCDAQSSLFPPSEENWAWNHIVFDKSIKIPVITLDFWAKEQGITHIDFLWLDMQGSECQMLQASPNILQTVKVIKTEFSRKPFYEGTIIWEEYKKWLESLGFKCIYEDLGSHGDAILVR